MAKIKLTKGELKRQRDCLKQFTRYLPTLQLKKQQLQLEILQQDQVLEEEKRQLLKKKQAIGLWIGLLTDDAKCGLKLFLSPRKIITHSKNIAGTEINVFDRVEFNAADYDLFVTPLWVDAALEAFKAVIVLKIEISVIEEGVVLLRNELRTTSQRVNLFEKVKIPEAEENIRLIKIYIGDQMANSVGRCKIAKRKIEEFALAGEVI